ncbi:unnamed protein product [Lactuca virosa]|uniref:Uncharacterized protein n=1 Tax=Lactuca virosa TaxID=75947 RepID=A0AAU9PPZ6_9ASTR|nr:unnamed protein product [Lactuca virosa]
MEATDDHIDILPKQVRLVPPMTTEPVQTPVTRSPASHMEFFSIPDVRSCGGVQRLASNSIGSMSDHFPTERCPNGGFAFSHNKSNDDWALRPPQ